MMNMSFALALVKEFHPKSRYRLKQFTQNWNYFSHAKANDGFFFLHTVFCFIEFNYIKDTLQRRFL